MNPTVKQKWIEALRSGEYKQGKGQLRDDNDNYCCLGVLCDLYHKETKNGNWITHNSNSGPITNYCQKPKVAFEYHNNIYRIWLPTFVADWAGLEGTNPFVKTTNLANYNDSLNFSFTEIADLIEKEL